MTVSVFPTAPAATLFALPLWQEAQLPVMPVCGSGVIAGLKAVVA
jgi:hypothetical protein